MPGTHGTPGWLPLESGPVYVVVHVARAAVRRNTSVLLLPPFGWDEVCSYRPRRQWAIELADAGFTTARIDLPGTGESVGGPRDQLLARRWLDAVLGAITWLRAASGAERTAVIGVGLGALLAVQALAADAPIDELMVWAAPAGGRAYIRELQMHSRIVAAPFARDEDGRPPADGTVELTGFAITADTADTLGDLRLSKLSFPDLTGRGALMITREGIQSGNELAAALSAAGATLTTAPGRDYFAMTAPPEEPHMPRATIRRSITWLEERSVSTAAPTSVIQAPPTVSSITFEQDSRMIKESILTYDGVAGRIVGVLGQPLEVPEAPFCVVFLNVGATRRIGPNRMWVETARRWAARGVPTVRMDLEAMGDSDGDGLVYTNPSHLYSPHLTEQAIGLLDRLQQDGVADRFVFVGLCSSAYWGWQAAVADSRVVGAYLINQFAVHWTQRLLAERDRATTKYVFTGGIFERVRRFGITQEDIRRGITAFRPSLSWGAGSEEQSQYGLIQSSFDTLRDRGTAVLLMLTQDEQFYRQLERLGLLSRLAEWPNLKVERLPSRDHNVRALWLQRMVHQRLDTALDELLTRL